MIILLLITILLYLLFFATLIGFCCRKKEKFLSIYPMVDRPLTLEERVRYYLGNLQENEFVNLFTTPFNSEVHLINRDYDFIDDTPYNREINHYYQRFKKENPQFFEKQFIFLPGDVIHSRQKVPMLTKTRPIENKGKNVLLPLNNERHWKPVFDVKYYDIPYDHKKNIMVWRGAATGKDKRVPLVEGYYNFPGFEIDVGFTNYTDNYTGERNQKYLKNKLHMGELLQCKFLLSVEGNDVASNLKWIMGSNSVCIRPHSENESWLMEGLLKPWVHYVPVRKDFKDLLNIYKWCVTNPEKCKRIIKNCKEFIKQFMDSKKEEKIIQEVMKGYASKVNVF